MKNLTDIKCPLYVECTPGKSSLPEGPEERGKYRMCLKEYQISTTISTKVEGCRIS